MVNRGLQILQILFKVQTFFIPWEKEQDLSATPAEADNYGIGWTELFASATVDAIGRPVRQALAI
jgi:hypothetical protein